MSTETIASIDNTAAEALTEQEILKAQGQGESVGSNAWDQTVDGLS